LELISTPTGFRLECSSAAAATHAPMPRPATRKLLADWSNAGWSQKPNIAYCTIVHVDETNDKAIKTGLFRA
jgi:hypothetical protein